MAFSLSNSRSHDSVLSSSDLRVAEKNRYSSLEHSYLNMGRNTRPNFYNLWKKSASNDCIPGPRLSQCSRGEIGRAAFHSCTSSSSGYLKSLCSHTSERASFISRSNHRISEINESISSRERLSGNNIRTSSMTQGYHSDVPLPAYISTQALLIGQEKVPIRPASEARPCSFTMDSFMDIESIDEPLETALGSSASPDHDNHNKQSMSPGPPSFSNVSRLSPVTNSSNLLSVFESRHKHQSMAQIPPLPTTNKTKRRGFLNLNHIKIHKKSFSLPPERYENPDLWLSLTQLQLTHQTQKKGFPALRKRVSAVFRTELQNEPLHSINPIPGIIKEPSIDTPDVCFVADSIIRQQRSNSLSDTSEASTTFLFKDKPLPSLPIENDTDFQDLFVKEEDDVDDTVTASSCLDSRTECFTVLDGNWPEPPRHMIFLDPDMADIFRYNQFTSPHQKIDTYTATQNELHNTCSEIHDFRMKRGHLNESVKDLLSSVEIYINGFQITSQSLVPNTLIFPNGTIINPTESGYTVELTIRAPVKSQLISFCTLYADTTLTFEQQASPAVTTTRMQAEISMKSVNLPSQKSSEELSIAILDKNSMKETADVLDVRSERGRSPRILIELPCTLGELVTVISNIASHLGL